MSLWRQVRGGVRVLTNRQRADRELSDEVRHYVDTMAAELVARGCSPEAARRAAHLEVGNMTVTREEVRSHGWENAVGTLIGDLHYAGRRLRHSPGATAVSVITLAVGIGASTAIFSAVNPILFHALPYPHPDRIVMIADANPYGQVRPVTFGTYRELAQRSRAFQHMAVLRPWQPTMVGDAEPERLAGQRVGAGFFRALGVSPFMGRDFRADDDRPNGPNVVILGNALWHRRFAGDPTIVGRQIKLDDIEYTVVGVMPANFENVLAPETDLWTPLQYNTVFGPDSREWGHHLRLVARLEPGIGIDQARRELNMVAHTPAPEFVRVPWASLSNGLIVSSLQADVTRSIRPALLAVVGAVVLLLAIACVNVTNLLLARGAQRRGEFAMRAALGAGRTRLVRQMLTESLTLALIGGVLGMVLAVFGVRALVALSPPELPRLSAIRIDGAVFTLGMIVTTLIGVVVGILPALSASRQDLQAAVQEVSRRTAGGHQRIRGALVVAEVALALVLLVSAGLLLRTIARVFAVPVGFQSSGLLTMQVQETGQEFRADSASRQPSADSARWRFYAEALDAVRAVPGVTAAAFTSLLPLSGDIDTYGVHFESDREQKEDGAALRYAVTPGYFDAMRIPLRRGRLLDAHDGPRCATGRAHQRVLCQEQVSGRATPLANAFTSAPTMASGSRSSASSAT